MKNFKDFLAEAKEYDWDEHDRKVDHHTKEAEYHADMKSRMPREAHDNSTIKGRDGKSYSHHDNEQLKHEVALGKLRRVGMPVHKEDLDESATSTVHHPVGTRVKVSPQNERKDRKIHGVVSKHMDKDNVYVHWDNGSRSIEKHHELIKESLPDGKMGGANPHMSPKWPGKLEKKIDVFHKGEYHHSTNAYTSAKNAKAGHLALNPHHKSDDVKAVYSESVNESLVESTTDTKAKNELVQLMKHHQRHAASHAADISHHADWVTKLAKNNKPERHEDSKSHVEMIRHHSKELEHHHQEARAIHHTLKTQYGYEE